MDPQPNYYAILPAKVRYDQELSSTAKLFYAEITALANKEGYCWATNKYFAQLYGLSESAITKTLTQLNNKGYIHIDLGKEAGFKRTITPVDMLTPIVKNSDSYSNNFRKPIVKNYSKSNLSNRSGNTINEYSKGTGSNFVAVDKSAETGTNPLFREWCDIPEPKPPFNVWVQPYL